MQELSVLAELPPAEERTLVLRRMRQNGERLYRNISTGRCYLGVSIFPEDTIRPELLQALVEEEVVGWTMSFDGISEYALNLAAHTREERKEKPMSIPASTKFSAEELVALTPEQLARQIAWIKQNLSTREEWALSDYREFYDEDVPLLLVAIERLAGLEIPEFRDPGVYPEPTSEELAFVQALGSAHDA